MDSKLNIETITNGLLTLQKVKQLYKPIQRDEEGKISEVLQLDKLALLQDALTVITDFLPSTRGGSFGEAFRLGSHYSSTYRGIKQHFRQMGNNGAGSGNGIAQLMKTLKVIAPVFNNREKVYMDKVIKIIDILGS